MRSAAFAIPFVLVTLPALAISDAELIAARTGAFIGGAERCGVPHDKLVAVGRNVIGKGRAAAHGISDVRRAQAAHKAAVIRGAALVSSLGVSACDDVISRFRAIAGEP